MKRSSSVLFALLFALSVALSQPSAHGQGSNPAKPVLAYYFPWWETSDWNAGRMSDLPAELYNGGDDQVIRRHLQQAGDSGVNGFICTWYGPDEPRLTERCDKLLKLSTERNFSVIFMPDQAADPTGKLKSAVDERHYKNRGVNINCCRQWRF